MVSFNIYEGVHTCNLCSRVLWMKWLVHEPKVMTLDINLNKLKPYVLVTTEIYHLRRQVLGTGTAEKNSGSKISLENLGSAFSNS